MNDQSFLSGLPDAPDAIENGRNQGREVAKAMLINRLYHVRIIAYDKTSECKDD
jgi:hypothetical protein